MKLTSLPTNKLVALFGGVTACWLLFGTVAAVSGAGNLRQVTAALLEQRARLAEQRRQAAELPELQRRYTEAREALGPIRPVAAARLYVPGLVGDLAGLASDHGLELQSAEPQQQDQARPGEMRVAVALAGDYKGLLEFVAALQEAPKAIRIDGLEAKRDPDAPAGRIVARLDLLADELPGLPELPELAQLPTSAPADAILRPGAGAPRGEAPAVLVPGPQLPPGGVMEVPSGGEAGRTAEAPPEGQGERRDDQAVPGAGGGATPPNLGEAGGVERPETRPEPGRPRREAGREAPPRPAGKDPGWDFSPPPGGWFGGQPGGGGGQGGQGRPQDGQRRPRTSPDAEL